MFSTRSTQRLALSLESLSVRELMPATRTEKVLFGSAILFPVAWLLGLGEHVWLVVGLVLVAELVRDRSIVHLPRPLLIWVGFVLLAAASIAGRVLDGELVGVHTSQFTVYVCGALLFVYVFSADAGQLADSRLLAALCLLWIIVVAGGVLAIPLYQVDYATPGEELLRSLDADARLASYAHVDFTTVGHLSDGDLLDHRPRTFFSETNHWGSAYALLLPAVAMVLLQLRSPTSRLVLMTVGAFSLIPFVLSRNRWVWLGLALMGLYLLARYWKPRRAHVPWLAGASVVIAAIVVLTPAGDLIGDRLSTGGSEEARRLQHELALEEIGRSPLLGFGGPIPSGESWLDDIFPDGESLGWDSQLLNTMIFHGIPALGLMIGFFGWLILATRRAHTPVEFAAHIGALTLAFHMVFYVVVPHRLVFLLVVGAAALRRQFLDGRLSRRETLRLWKREARGPGVPGPR